jgi:hypothetical protein
MPRSLLGFTNEGQRVGSICADMSFPGCQLEDVVQVPLPEVRDFPFTGMAVLVAWISPAGLLVRGHISFLYFPAHNHDARCHGF